MLARWFGRSSSTREIGTSREPDVVLRTSVSKAVPSSFAAQPEGQCDAPLSAQLKQNNDSGVLPPYVDDYREP